jgi:acyl homoserine lactone synthase
MSKFIVAERRAAPNELLDRLAAYRFEVFVKRLGWRISSFEGREQDEYDRDDAVYVVSLNEADQVTGCSRLLPTSKPYLLQAKFADCVGSGVPLPCSPWVWEMSRFAAGDPGGARGQTAAIASKLFERSMIATAQRGGTQVVGVMSLAVERICRRFGFSLYRLGEPTAHESGIVVACGVNLVVRSHAYAASSNLAVLVGD